MNGGKGTNPVSEQIEKNGRAFFYTKGISMLPMLKEGRDISVLVPVSGEPRKGDVVLFKRLKRGEELVLHRIIRRCGDTYVIRGDNTYHDEAVKRENIIAILEGFFRKGKYYDCKKSKKYRIYAFMRTFFYPIRRFTRYTLRIAAAKIKNNVFRLNNVHLDDIFGKNGSK